MKRRTIAGILVALVSMGLATATAQGNSPDDPVTGAPLLQPVTSPLSPLAEQQVQSLGPGARVVECAPGLAQLPAGVTPSRPLGFMQTHPAFTVLADGHCAFDTSIQPTRPIPQHLDAP
jgi:hypothetical protein